jgi:hypothetical protein
MDALTPAEARVELDELVTLLSELDAMLEALAGSPRAGAVVQLVAAEARAARERLLKHRRRLAQHLPPRGRASR